MVFGPNQREKRLAGNILFSTLTLFLMCLFLMQALLENYRLTIDTNLRIEKFYQAKIIKEMFLSEVDSLVKEGKGAYDYTVGSVMYEKENQIIKLIITVKPFQFEFTEKTNNVTESDTE
ncbi:hypothetical protein E1H99_06835 [Enterococcus hirae]|nr:competence type IV pilus minor pilin ComGG [Enterococcus sp. 10A9_DIV0425]THE12907.1 hypothetical protein E1H99_06835 [Enterococcus hirae]